MRFRRLIVMLSLVVFYLYGNSLAEDLPFDWPESYTVEYTQKGQGDPISNIYTVSGNKARNEITSLNSSTPVPSITIFDLDKQVMISLFPNGVYKKSSTREIKNMRVRHMFDTHGTWTKISSESLNGIDADKYKITYDKSDRFILAWLSRKTNEPLKMENYDGSLVINVNRFVPGPVNQDLFSPPAGYKDWDNP